MTPRENQDRLVAVLRFIEDPQERLAFIQDRTRKQAPLPEAFRTETHRIRGCVTRVWLRSTWDGTVCTFEVDSESSMVRGLAALVAEVYSGCSPEKVAEFSCTLLEDAGLDRIITPTRLQGLAHLQTAIRQCKFEP